MPAFPTTSPTQRSRLSLDGLSVGDAFGQMFFYIPSDRLDWMLNNRLAPVPPDWLSARETLPPL